MRIDHFLRTIYLGDRACKAITFDGWNKRVSLIINEISRVRSESGNWEYYNDENIVDAALVFTGVKAAALSPPGALPSDEIDILSVEPINAAGSLFRIKFHMVGSVPQSEALHDLELEVIAEGVHLEDPSQPGLEIVE